MRDFDKIEEEKKGQNVRTALLICLSIFVIIFIITVFVIYLSNQYYTISQLSNKSDTIPTKTERTTLAKSEKREKSNKTIKNSSQTFDNTTIHKHNWQNGLFNLKLYLFDERFDDNISNLAFNIHKESTQEVDKKNPTVIPTVKTDNKTDNKTNNTIYAIELVSYENLPDRAKEVAEFYKRFYSDLYIEESPRVQNVTLYRLICCTSKNEEEVDATLADMKKRFKKIFPVKIKIFKL